MAGEGKMEDFYPLPAPNAGGMSGLWYLSMVSTHLRLGVVRNRRTTGAAICACPEELRHLKQAQLLRPTMRVCSRVGKSGFSLLLLLLGEGAWADRQASLLGLNEMV